MTEVPGTDRDQARENVLSETPLVPEGVENAEDPRGEADDDGQTEDGAKPAPGSTEFTT